MLGLRELDLTEPKPGKPHNPRRGPLTLSVDAAGTMQVSYVGNGAQLGLTVQRDPAGNYTATAATYQAAKQKPLAIQGAADHRYVGAAIGRLNLGQDRDVNEALSSVLRAQPGISSSYNAGYWLADQVKRDWQAKRALPMVFEKPANLPNAKPDEVLRYHLGVPPAKQPDGSMRFTLLGDAKAKESLVLEAAADGTVRSVKLNGHELPPTHEVREVVIGAATKYRPGGASMLAIINDDLKNKHGHLGMNSGRDVHDYLNKLRDPSAFEEMIEAAKKAGHGHHGKTRLSSMAATFVLSGAALAAGALFPSGEAEAAERVRGVATLKNALNEGTQGPTASSRPAPRPD